MSPLAEKIVFIDVETGGLDLERSPIIQMAAIATTVGCDEIGRIRLTEIEALEQKIAFDPSTATSEALEANSYDEAAWNRESVTLRTAHARLNNLVSKHATIPMRGKRPPHRPYQLAQIAGHNAARFDAPMIQRDQRQFGMFWPGHYLVLDTLQLALWTTLVDESFRPENMQLGTLARALEVDVDGSDVDDLELHDALVDVRVNIAVVNELLWRLT